jgi:hypothetical protein
MDTDKVAMNPAQPHMRGFVCGLYLASVRTGRISSMRTLIYTEDQLEEVG